MTGMADELRVAVTVGFLVSGAWCLWRCVDLARSRRLADGIGYAAHVLMAVSMVAMVWSPPWLAGSQMAVFAVACGWFVVQAVGIPVAALRLHPESAPTVVTGMHSGPGGRLRCAHHAVLMAVMVWMFHTLTAGSMAMPGMSAPAPGRTPVFAAVGGVYAVIVAGLLAVTALAAPRRTRSGLSSGDDAVHAVMTGGMAVMLLVMA